MIPSSLGRLLASFILGSFCLESSVLAQTIESKGPNQQLTPQKGTAVKTTAALPEKLRVSFYLLHELRQNIDENPIQPPVEKFEFQSGKTTQVVDMIMGRRTEEITYPNPPPLIFFKTIPDSPEPRRQTLASVELPPDWTRALLLVFQSPVGSTLHYTIYPVRMDGAGLPLNHAALINLSGQAITAKIMGKVYALDAYSNVQFSYSGAENNNLPLSLAATVEGKSQVVVSTGFAAFPGTRKVLVACPPAGDSGHWQILELEE